MSLELEFKQFTDWEILHYFLLYSRRLGRKELLGNMKYTLEEARKLIHWATINKFIRTTHVEGAYAKKLNFIKFLRSIEARKITEEEELKLKLITGLKEKTLSIEEFKRRLNDDMLYEEIRETYAGKILNIPKKKLSKSLRAYEMFVDVVSINKIALKLKMPYSHLLYIRDHLVDYKMKLEKKNNFFFVFKSNAQKIIDVCGGCYVRIPSKGEGILSQKHFIGEQYQKMKESPENIAKDIVEFMREKRKNPSKWRKKHHKLGKILDWELRPEEDIYKDTLKYVRRVIKCIADPMVEIIPDKEEHYEEVEKSPEAKQMDTFFNQQTKEEKEAEKKKISLIKDVVEVSREEKEMDKLFPNQRKKKKPKFDEDDYEFVPVILEEVEKCPEAKQMDTFFGQNSKE